MPQDIVIEPVVLAVLAVVALYVLVIALIPKHMLNYTTRYTRASLKRLQSESAIMAAPTDRAVSLMREKIEGAGPLARAFFTLPGAKSAYPRFVRANLIDKMNIFLPAGLVILLVLITLLKKFAAIGIVIAFVLTYLVMRMYVSRRINKRNHAFVEGFPDALGMIVRSVRTGYPLNAAVRMVADNAPPPVCIEFKQVADEASYGSSLVESLQRMAQRLDEPDVRFFVVVLTVQQEVGGNLAEVLNNLGEIIRKRKHLRMKVKALTSEGRTTAIVLGSLPIAVAAMINFVSPTHLDPFFVTKTGNILLAVAIGMVAFGVFIINRMSQVEV